MELFSAYLTIFIGVLPSMCAGILATFAITLIFKTSYTTNFAQGVISAVGAYVAVELTLEHGLPLWGVAIIGVVVAFGVGMLIDVLIFRQGKNVNALGKQIITMGLISLFVGIIPFIFAVANYESVPVQPFIPLTQQLVIPMGATSQISIPYNTIVAIGITLVLMVLVFVLLQKSKWGLSVRATASNEIVAGMMGINTKVITAVSWAIAGALGAVAAIIYVGNATFSSAYVMTSTQINAFLAGILGGFITFHGPVVGAIIIYMLNALVGCVCIHVPGLSMWKSAIVYGIVMLLVLIKPQGLFGKKMVKKV
ncbi:MAG: branched-chain amino acid ABC transporter permease [Clostridia bacterium]|nr:branched-chain amino acid ABC transporter permease [Clostridia bacterium]